MGLSQTSFAAPYKNKALLEYVNSQRKMVNDIAGFWGASWSQSPELIQLNNKLRELERSVYYNPGVPADDAKAAKALSAYRSQVRLYANHRAEVGGLTGSQGIYLDHANNPKKEVTEWQASAIAAARNPNVPQNANRNGENAAQNGIGAHPAYTPTLMPANPGDRTMTANFDPTKAAGPAENFMNSAVGNLGSFLSGFPGSGQPGSGAAGGSDAPSAGNYQSGTGVNPNPSLPRSKYSAMNEATDPAASAALINPGLGGRPSLGTGGSITRAEAMKRLTDMADASDCAKKTVGNRSRLGKVKGYYHNVVVAFARSVCRPNDSAKLAMLRQNRQPDPPGIMRVSGGNADQGLVNTYATLMSLGLRESNGNFKEGRDRSASNYGKSAEAGLYQTSYDVAGRGKSQKYWVNGMVQLENEYEKNPQACGTEFYGVGVPQLQSGRREQPWDRFQRLLRNCPQLAVEHAAITTQNNSRHYGPLRRGEAPAIPACKQLLNEVYETVTSDPASICSGLAVEPVNGVKPGGTQTAASGGNGRS